MKKFEVWIEGFDATGNHGKAQLIDTVEAETFLDACKVIIRRPDTYERWGGYEIDWPGRINYYLWGCQLFDNEKDAREHFG